MHRLGPQCSAADTAERWRDTTRHDWQASRPLSVTLPTRPQLFHSQKQGLWQFWTAVFFPPSLMGPWRCLGPGAAAPVAPPILTPLLYLITSQRWQSRKWSFLWLPVVIILESMKEQCSPVTKKIHVFSPVTCRPKWWFVSASYTLHICITPVNQRTYRPRPPNTPCCSHSPKSRPPPFACLLFTYCLNLPFLVLCSYPIKCYCFICSGSTHRLRSALSPPVYRYSLNKHMTTANYSTGLEWFLQQQPIGVPENWSAQMDNDQFLSTGHNWVQF